MLDSRLKGLIYIILGFALILLFVSDLLIKILVMFFGVYLIYTGLQLRNSHKILFRIHNCFGFSNFFR